MVISKTYQKILVVEEGKAPRHIEEQTFSIFGIVLKKTLYISDIKSEVDQHLQLKDKRDKIGFKSEKE